MANGVNVKMGVSGLSQFKNNMNQAKQAVKTLDAQLALTEKQFKQSGDAESYMTEKSELLKAKLEQQKSVLANAEKALQEMSDKGVDKASKSYQDMYRQMLQAKGALLDTENEMNGVTDAADKASDGVSEMNSQLSRIGSGINYEQVSNSLSKISEGMDNAMKKAVSLGKAIVKDVLGAGSWADDLHTRAQYFGLTDEEMQRMEKTATLIDTPVEAIISAKKKLAKEKEAAGKNDMGAWAVLGIDPTMTKDPEDLLWKTGEALMKLTDESKQEAYAQELLGRSWSELIPLFTAGREEYEKTKDSWSVVPQESIDALAEMDDQYHIMEEELDTVKKQLDAALAPAVTEVMKVLSGLMQEFNKFLQTDKGKEMMQGLTDAVTALFSDIANVDPEDVMNTLTGVLEGIKEAFEWIKDNKDLVVGAVEAFIGAWVAVEISSGITTVLNLINGIKGLTATSAASAGATAGASWACAFASAAMKAAPFLAFLYTLLNPSEGKDALGNNDLIDENGDLTPEAEAYGLKKDENGEIYQDPFAANPKYVDPDFLKWQQEQAGKLENPDAVASSGGEQGEKPKTLAVGTNSDGERTAARYESIKALQRLQEATSDLTGGTEDQKKSSTELATAAGKLEGLPTEITDAIIYALSQVKINIDGYTAGQVLTPYVNAGMGGLVTKMIK